MAKSFPMIPLIYTKITGRANAREDLREAGFYVPEPPTRFEREHYRAQLRETQALARQIPHE